MPAVRPPARRALMPPEPAAAGGPGAEPPTLAFATDAASEDALRAGLSDRENPQVWTGTVDAAVAAVERAGSPAPRLIFVDLDGTPYPAGAIHELAAVCEVGTSVVALGSDGSARFSREVLLAGVSDYLIKPVTAAAVREAAANAFHSGETEPDGSCAVGFAGTGGSGATTLAAALALAASGRGRYVAVLDLGRTFAALPFMLDVEPAPGLDQLLDTAAGGAPDPGMVDGMAAARSDRIAVYGYRQSAEPPRPPQPAAVRWLVGQLKRRAHLVVVDGFDDPAARLAALADCDRRVLVVEPTRSAVQRGARLRALLGPERPAILARNHTRAFRRRAGARTWTAAGLPAPQVVASFEPSVPALADRGWPKGRLPAVLRRCAGALADLVLPPPGGVAAGAAAVTA